MLDAVILTLCDRKTESENWRYLSQNKREKAVTAWKRIWGLSQLWANPSRCARASLWLSFFPPCIFFLLTLIFDNFLIQQKEMKCQGKKINKIEIIWSCSIITKKRRKKILKIPQLMHLYMSLCLLVSGRKQNGWERRGKKPYNCTYALPLNLHSIWMFISLNHF